MVHSRTKKAGCGPTACPIETVPRAFVSDGKYCRNRKVLPFCEIARRETTPATELLILFHKKGLNKHRCHQPLHCSCRSSLIRATALKL